MKNFRVRLAVSLRSGMLDPQGEAVARTLQEIATSGEAEQGVEQANGKDILWGRIDAVRVGKLIEIELEALDVEQARTAVAAMSDRLLTHPVTERSEIVGEIIELGAPSD